MNIAHTDLKPGDRFRMTEAEEGSVSGLDVATVWGGTVHRVDGDRVFYGPLDWDYLRDHKNATWERLTPTEPKNLGAVIELTDEDGETVRVVRVGASFESDLDTLSWEEILTVNENPRILHEGWDGK